MNFNQGQIAIYPWPNFNKTACRTMCGHDASLGLLTNYPSSAPIKLIVRVYIVKGKDSINLFNYIFKLI